MTMQDDMLADALDHVLADQSTPAVVRAIEGGAPGAALWQALEDSGFCDALVPEDQGGAGLGLNEVFALLEACGRHLLPLPLAQTLLARALLTTGGKEAPVGPIALAVRGAEPGPVLVCQGAVADWLLVGDRVVAVDGGQTLELHDLRQARREPVGDRSLDAHVNLPAQAALRLPSPVDLQAQLALLLAAQMAGSMRQVFAMTLQFANERAQFGRSIGKFQAIQHQLSQMAEHTEAARMAARLGCSTRGFVADPLACAVAKAGTSVAVVPLTSIAHAVHGAIGITQEYDLQLHTRRLQAWRVAAGSESHWNERVGRALLAGPHESLPEFVRTELAAAP
jgi:acyl-CoA dehydrogenase